MHMVFQIDEILGENTIEASFTSCPMGEEGLECRRAEARRSVDCPRGIYIHLHINRDRAASGIHVAIHILWYTCISFLAARFARETIRYSLFNNRDPDLDNRCRSQIDDYTYVTYMFADTRGFNVDARTALMQCGNRARIHTHVRTIYDIPREICQRDAIIICRAAVCCILI